MAREMRRLLLAALVGFGLAPVVRAAAPADVKVDFNRDVRPILSQNCFKCHGADENARKAKLRLDTAEGAHQKTRKGLAAVVPGKAAESSLIERVFSTDEEEVMPPPSTKKVLSQREKNILKAWIEQGGQYQDHWAFVAPRPVAPPKVNDENWVRNPIDRFVLARLERESLRPSKEADKYTLVRRLYLDLIGLPPTPDEADAFVNDPSPDAYEKLVDKLQASPQYGERWARRWLDLARYADTNGYEKDRPRSIWPYRDWVIKAFNADMPFDRFTIEQLAGDMLPNPTREQRIATGFHRNTMQNEEGGVDPLEYRFHAMTDRVGTTGTVWLGLTVACAQCHTHKYDPITHKDYYGLMAFLNNADEPELEVPGPDQAAKKKEVEDKIAAATKDLANKYKVSEHKYQDVKIELSTDHGDKVEVLADRSVRILGEGSEKGVYTAVFETHEPLDRIRIHPLVDDGDKGPGFTKHGNFVLSEITVTAAPKGRPGEEQPVKLVKAESEFSQPGFPVDWAIDGKVSTGWAIDGEGRRNRMATFSFDKPVGYPGGTRFVVRIEQWHGTKHVLQRVKLSSGTPLNDKRPIEARRKEAVEQGFAKWAKDASDNAVKWEVVRPVAMKSNEPILTQLDDGSILVGGDITKSDTYELKFKTDVRKITGIRLEALPHESLPRGGPGKIYYEGPFGDFFLSEITMFDPAGKQLKFDKAAQDFAPAEKFKATASIDGDPQSGWAVTGQVGKPHYAAFGLAQPAMDGEFVIKMLFEKYYASALGRFRISVTTDPRAGKSAVRPEIEQILALSEGERSDEQKQTILAYYLDIAPETADARKEIVKLREQLPKPHSTLVMKERPAEYRRTTRLYHRGEFVNPRDPVEPAIPAWLPGLPKDAPKTRLGFARWLVSGENPLTGRVIVNRQWAAFWGKGIVRTTEDFGFQGELPVNQELLDWLAVEFVKQGWSFKKLNKLIVMSATYRQQSAVTPELLAKDPKNDLFARGPRFRVEAEIVRDSALKAAGILSTKMYGPSVFPPQPASVTTEGAYGPLQWNASTGEDRFRRSLYTFSKRTAPFALYNTFDGPIGDACVARREVSNTPLMALSVMNDKVFMEAAQAMGKAMAEAKESDEERVESIVRRFVARPVDKDEVAQLVAFAKTQRERFAKKQLDPAKVAGAAEGDVVERAVWTVVSRAVMNLDEAVTKN